MKNFLHNAILEIIIEDEEEEEEEMLKWPLKCQLIRYDD